MVTRPIIPVSLVRPDSHLMPKSAPVEPTVSFEQVLGQALNGVNQLQQQSDDLKQKLASGQVEYLHQVTAMSEKAGLAFELTLQIRNKVLEAYQEIMRTQI